MCKKLPVDAAANVVCEGRGCDRSYCERCILWLAGGHELRSSKEIAGWLCFCCRASKLLTRDDHKTLLAKFLRRDNELVPPQQATRGEAPANANANAGPFSRSRVALSYTTFAQQNFLIDRAQRSNRAHLLKNKELAVYQPEGIRVLSLFSGIECALVAVKQLGTKIAFWVVCEQDEEAIKVILAQHHDLVVKGILAVVRDVHDITPVQLSEWGGFHLVIGGR